MKIIMSQTVPGSVDGIRVSTYEAGIEYDLTATDGERDLAAAFVGAGFAEELGAEPDGEGDTAAPRRGRKPKAQ